MTAERDGIYTGLSEVFILGKQGKQAPVHFFIYTLNFNLHPGLERLAFPSQVGAELLEVFEGRK